MPKLARAIARSRRLTAAAGMALAVSSAAAVAALAASPAANADTSTTFTYTGGEQTYVVPLGVTSLQVVAIGAGGSDGAGQGGIPGGLGGNGAQVFATLPVSPGQTLYVEVGAGGTVGAADPFAFLPGGRASDGGGWGGGASDIRTCGVVANPLGGGCADGSPSSLASRLVIAAGGGGGGAPIGSTSGGNGGQAGAAGQNSGVFPDYAQGGGAPFVGIAGLGGSSAPDHSGAAGGFAMGGAGGAGVAGSSATGGGGGGGGGYYGGGGGGGSDGTGYAGAGGAGGSSYVTPAATASSVGSGGFSGGVVITPVVTDSTPPQLTPVINPPSPDGTNGWYRSDVQVGWNVTDPESAITSQTGCDPQTVTADTAGESFTCQATSGGGTSGATVTIKRDATPPSVALAGGPADGASYSYGSVPPAATCNATDATSGLASCTVSGYGTTLGSHTIVATAIDEAGNTATASATYSVVSAQQISGFFAPVHDNELNVAKGGSTVPLKFTVFDGTTPITDAADVTPSVSHVACPGASMVAVTVAAATAGSTTLRYDSSGAQFIYNWKIPSNPGACYQVTMTTSDGVSLSALFQVK